MMIPIAAQIDCAISCLAPTAFRPVLSSFQVCYLVRHFPVLNFDRLRLVLSLNMFRVYTAFIHYRRADGLPVTNQHCHSTKGIIRSTENMNKFLT